MSQKQDLANFKRGVVGFVQRSQREIIEAVGNTAAAIQTEVIERTRIRTGRAKSNWHIELGGPNFDVDPSIDDEDESTWISAEQAWARAKIDLPNLDRLNMQTGELDDIFISSGVDYILKLEAKDTMAEGTVHWAATFLPVVVTGSVEKG